MTENAYSSNRACSKCGNAGPQIWVDAKEASSTYGLCQNCRLAPSAQPLVLAQTESAKLAAERSDTASKIAVIQNFKISTIEHKQAFAAALVDVQDRLKKLEAREKEITRPALASIESTRALFRGPRSTYEELERAIKEKLAEYEREISSQVASAVSEAQTRAAAGDVVGARAAIDQVNDLATLQDTKVEGVQVRHPWTYQVINVDILDRKFLLPNFKEITVEMKRQLAASPNDAPVLPGIRFFRDTTIAGTGKKGKG